MERSIDELIEGFEVEAIKRNDLERAIRLNWLRNTYRNLQLDDDRLIMMLQDIHYKEPSEWPKLTYKSLKVVCAWCNKVLKEGPPTEVSHGICEDCEKKVNAEIDAREAFNKNEFTGGKQP